MGTVGTLVQVFSNVVLNIASTFDFSLINDNSNNFGLRLESMYIFRLELMSIIVVEHVKLEGKGFVKDRKSMRMVN